MIGQEPDCVPPNMSKFPFRQLFFGSSDCKFKMLQRWGYEESNVSRRLMHIKRFEKHAHALTYTGGALVRVIFVRTSKQVLCYIETVSYP
jgi:hypothetical protein